MDHRPRPDDEFDFNASDLSKQFEQLLRNRRLNELEEQAEQARRQRSASPAIHNTPAQPAPAPAQPTPTPQSQQRRQTPPTYRSYRNTPLVPCAPQDAHALRFRALLHAHSVRPTKFENPGLLDEALTHVPLERIYTTAEEEHNIMKGIAASMGENQRPEWGYQDCVIKGLLRWFKREFFEFVYNPTCTRCHGPTLQEGTGHPTPDEAARGANNRVELYKCQNCGGWERFPRYTDVWTLLETRKGRVGEFADCFAMLCRAAGARVRWVWNSEDHVWTEVYSEHQRRWIHVDPCEEAWDNPRMYTEGWNHKLAYCIAFSADGATDVTRRYVRNHTTHGAARTRCPEEVLLWIMYEIRQTRRKDTAKEIQHRLRREDDREERELQRYVADSVASEMINSFPGATGQTRQRPEDVKAPAERPQPTADWASQQQHHHQTFGGNPNQDR